MSYARLGLRFVVLIIALTLGAYLFAVMSTATTTSAQTSPAKTLRPDLRRALATKTRDAKATPAARPGGHLPQRAELPAPAARPRAKSRGANGGDAHAGRRPSRPPSAGWPRRSNTRARAPISPASIRSTCACPPTRRARPPSSSALLAARPAAATW